MPAPVNAFKQSLLAHKPQIGLWVALANPIAAELCAGAGFDWILIDGEHAPNDIPLLASQLQAAAGQPSHAVVRLPVGETWMIKQALDIGAQTLLIPMVESRAQAEAAARACFYPPRGIRGVGASLARASNYNRIGDYVQTANDEICLLVQIESRAALANLDAIATTDGVDGLFIGPADLAADMGHLGNSAAPEVVAAVEKAILRIRELGKPAGIMITDLELARHYQELGASLVAIGSDVTLLVAAANNLLEDYKSGGAAKVAAVRRTY